MKLRIARKVVTEIQWWDADWWYRGSTRLKAYRRMRRKWAQSRRL